MAGLAEASYKNPNLPKRGKTVSIRATREIRGGFEANFPENACLQFEKRLVCGISSLARPVAARFVDHFLSEAYARTEKVNAYFCA